MWVHTDNPIRDFKPSKKYFSKFPISASSEAAAAFFVAVQTSFKAATAFFVAVKTSSLAA